MPDTNKRGDPDASPNLTRIPQRRSTDKPKTDKNWDTPARTRGNRTGKFEMTTGANTKRTKLG